MKKPVGAQLLTPSQKLGILHILLPFPSCGITYGRKGEGGGGGDQLSTPILIAKGGCYLSRREERSSFKGLAGESGGGMASGRLMRTGVDRV